MRFYAVVQIENSIELMLPDRMAIFFRDTYFKGSVTWTLCRSYQHLDHKFLWTLLILQLPRSLPFWIASKKRISCFFFYCKNTLHIHNALQ